MISHPNNILYCEKCGPIIIAKTEDWQEPTQLPPIKHCLNCSFCTLLPIIQVAQNVILTVRMKKFVTHVNFVTIKEQQNLICSIILENIIFKCVLKKTVASVNICIFSELEKNE